MLVLYYRARFKDPKKQLARQTGRCERTSTPFPGVSLDKHTPLLQTQLHCQLVADVASAPQKPDLESSSAQM